MKAEVRPAEEAPTWESERHGRRVFRSKFPETDAVFAGLSNVLSPLHDESTLIAIEREPNEWRSTFPSEVVTCRFSNGRVERVLCKYGPTDYVSGHGHRGGVAHEALVYERVLNQLRLRPHCHGTYHRGDETWLVLEFIDGVPRLELAEEGIPVLSLAARWSGLFHAATEGVAANAASAFMNRYDDGYYAAWCQRTSDYAGLWHDEFPWLAQLCERFSRVAGDLLAGQEVIVHGEFTPHNVIFRDGEVFPVDWESAAIGAGEIDLASLTDMWPQDDVNQAVREYVRARWPDAVPPNFSERLAAARIYWVLRWLGNRPELTVREKNRSRFALLGTYGNELGLIAP